MSPLSDHRGPSRREFLAFGAGAFVVVALPLARRHSRVVRRTLPVMGTVAELAVVHRDERYAHAALDDAMAELRWVERTMTRFTTTSEIGRANAGAAAAPVPVSAETAFVVAEALRWADATDGAFDPAILETVQLWDVTHRQWRPYLVAPNTDWWVSFYPAANSGRPTGPLCDGCHSVNYNVQTKAVTEWNVGCEKCHGPGSEHVRQPTVNNIVNPAKLDFVRANDTCIQCHSQGQPLTNPIEGRHYDWPVGFDQGKNLKDFSKLEEHKLGETTFTHFADGTAHKNRMQGNDFVQSVMYRRGVTCFSCHDVHGTANRFQGRHESGEVLRDARAAVRNTRARC